MRVLEMLSAGEIDIHDPAHIAEYYRRLFEDARDDPALTDAVRRRSYEEVSEHYRLIGRPRRAGYRALRRPAGVV